MESIHSTISVVVSLSNSDAVATAVRPLSSSTMSCCAPVSQFSGNHPYSCITTGASSPAMLAALIFSAAVRTSASVPGYSSVLSPAAARWSLLTYMIGMDTP